MFATAGCLAHGKGQQEGACREGQRSGWIEGGTAFLGAQNAKWRCPKCIISINVYRFIHYTCIRIHVYILYIYNVIYIIYTIYTHKIKHPDVIAVHVKNSPHQSVYPFLSLNGSDLGRKSSRVKSLQRLAPEFLYSMGVSLYSYTEYIIIEYNRYVFV